MYSFCNEYLIVFTSITSLENLLLSISNAIKTASLCDLFEGWSLILIGSKMITAEALTSTTARIQGVPELL